MKQLNSVLLCLNRFHLLRAAALCAVFLAGCEKDPEPIYDNGVVTGYITLSSPGYETIYGNNVKVVAHGPYGSRSAQSDAQGNYTLSDLGNGTYEIEFIKEDFGVLSRPGIQVFGNDTVSMVVRLYKKTNYKMPRLTAVKSPETGQVEIKTDIPASGGEQLQIRLFLGDTKGVSYKNYKYTEIASVYSRGTIIYLNYNVNPPGSLFQSGQTRYLVYYVCNVDDPGYYNEYYDLTIYSTADQQQRSQVFVINPI